MRPFGCPVTILNTLDPLGKFQGKVDEGFLVGYPVCSKAFRVFNSRTRIIQETLHVNFLENKPNVAGTGPTWLFDIDSLTRTMNYQSVINNDEDVGFDGKEHDFDAKKPESEVDVSSSSNLNAEFEDCSDNSSNEVNAVGSIVPTVGKNSLNSTNTFSAADPSNTDVSPTYGKSSFIDASQLPDDPYMPELEDITCSDTTSLIQQHQLLLDSTKQGLVRGLPKLKFEKVHLCSACTMGKSKKKSYKPKSEDTNQEKLYLLHMDLCGAMRVESVNEKKYILVIVDDYSRFTWVNCLRSKDEAPDFIIKFLKMIQVRLKVPVRRIQTDNGTEFVNQTLREYYKVGISHETSVARSPQQNGVVERRNRTLIEAARTMLIYAQAPLFLWAEAVDTSCYTQNRSIVRVRHGKTPYELLHNKLIDLSFLHVFSALCYPTNDSENLGKLQPKADIGIFIGYAPTNKAFWIYNRCTRQIVETIHVDFDELTTMAFEQSSSGPALHELTPITISSGFVPKPTSSTPFVPPLRNDWDLLFQHFAPELAESTCSPSLTTVNQHEPSPSKSQTTLETQPPVIPQDVKEDNHDIEVAHMGYDLIFGLPIPEVTSDQSSSTISSHTIMHPDHQIPQHNRK
uniref:Retrovirus-related Pol polyprotein from transposon TNT 1-94 n=1 Tax=Tanacetum cinerariifolium TaxID=118510 RepID=A0A6L2LTX6_TANCI|nr:retrovirus-related Pol polyprotein from transposon TNT 1-94 [Tanacetum cinerariifolium]